MPVCFLVVSLMPFFDELESASRIMNHLCFWFVKKTSSNFFLGFGIHSACSTDISCFAQWVASAGNHFQKVDSLTQEKEDQKLKPQSKSGHQTARNAQWFSAPKAHHSLCCCFYFYCYSTTTATPMT